MTQDQYPDATPQHPDGARIVQPFAFTTGGGGDFRPIVEKVEKKKPVDKVAEGPKADPAPPLVESATAPAALLTQAPTADEFEKQLAASQNPQQSAPAPKSDFTVPPNQTEESSASPVKPVPSLAGKAKSKESQPNEGSSQTSS